MRYLINLPPRRSKVCLGLRRSVIAVTVICACAAAMPAVGQAKARLDVVYGVVGHRVVATGQVTDIPRGSRVVLETRDGRKIRARRGSRLRGNRFSLRWRIPARANSLVLRVRTHRSGGRKKTLVAGKWRKLKLAGLPKGRHLAPLKSGAIESAPAPGQPGTLVVTGSAKARVGDAVALGVTSATPYGLIAKVLAVSRHDGKTFIEITPIALTEVIPVGAMNVTIAGSPSTSVAARGKRAFSSRSLGDRLTRAASCDGGVSMDATAQASLDASVNMDVSWQWFKAPKVTFTGKLNASATVGASVTGKASCSLSPVPLLPADIPLARGTFMVGPVPVVIVANGQAYLSASADARAEMSTSATASFTATAGIKYDGGFSPFGSLSHSFTASPPSVSATGTAQATVTPTVDVLLDGLAGPRVDLNAGLKLSASSSQEPWWRLTAPIDLGAKLRLHAWKLNLESDRLQVWSAEPQLAAADVTQLDSPRQRAVLTWDTATDMDLHIWDADGNHTYYVDLGAIPGARLLEDIIPGYGPETFEETSSPGRTYTYGVCAYSGSADINLTVFDPSGSSRSFDRSLPWDKSAVLVTSSPSSGGYIPEPGWCGDDDPVNFN